MKNLNYINKKFIVVSHIFADGPAQALIKYLTEKEIAKEVVFIGHPLLPIPNEPNVSFLTRYEKGKKIEEITRNNFGHRFSLHYFENFIATIWWVLKRKQTYDVFIGANNLNAFAGIVLKYFGRAKKVIFYCVDYVPQRFNNPIVNYSYHLLDKLAVSFADEVWNLSPRMNEAREKYKKLHINQAKCKIVPMGIWFDEIERVPFEKVDKHSLVFMGHLLKKQGVQQIIKAIPDILKEIPDLNLLIIGKGEYEEELRQLVKDLLLNKAVIFLGYIDDHEKMENILAKCGCAVALYEKGDLNRNFSYYADPGKIKDYLGAGLPIIMSDVPYNANYLQNKGCGLIIDNSKEAAVSAIVKLLKNIKELKKFRENAITVAKDSDWNNIYSNAFNESKTDKKMRVLLIQQNYDSQIVHPPLGLGYLASFLKKNGQEVLIYDGTLENAGNEDFLGEIKRFSPDLIGISVLSRGYTEAENLIKLIKKHFTKLPVVIGGTQITAAPKESLRELGADFAIFGEGEETLAELASAISHKGRNLSIINGLVYKNGNKIIQNKPRALIEDLDSIPFPQWNLINPKNYRIYPILQPNKGSLVAPIMTSRGCPYNCSFCASNVTWERKIRFRSPENVIEEIKFLKENFGIDEIHFSDDNFTMDQKRAEKICDLLVKEKLNIHWQCPNGVRIDKLSDILLSKMRKSGCFAIGLGIESGSQKVLDENNKQLDLSQIGKILAKIKKYKIMTNGFFILGLPGDNRNTIQETISFALVHDFDRVWFNLFTPYPGSPAFSSMLKNEAPRPDGRGIFSPLLRREQNPSEAKNSSRSFPILRSGFSAKEDKRLNKIDWWKQDCSTAVYKIEGLSLKELEMTQREALWRFYLRPKVMISLLKSLGLKEMKSLLMTRFIRNSFNRIFNNS